jgi:hypothetical protein
VLEGGEWRKLFSSIPTETVGDLREHAPIATLTCSFARIGAALKMKVEDLRPRGSAWSIRLHDKRRQALSIPRHLALAGMLRSYFAAIGIVEDGGSGENVGDAQPSPRFVSIGS